MTHCHTTGKGPFVQRACRPTEQTGGKRAPPGATRRMVWRFASPGRNKRPCRWLVLLRSQTVSHACMHDDRDPQPARMHSILSSLLLCVHPVSNSMWVSLPDGCSGTAEEVRHAWQHFRNAVGALVCRNTRAGAGPTVRRMSAPLCSSCRSCSRSVLRPTNHAGGMTRTAHLALALAALARARTGPQPNRV